MRKYNYVFLTSYMNFYKFMYKEMENDNEIKVFYGKESLIKWADSKIAHMHMNNKYLKKIPGKSIWYKHALSKIKFENDKPICFVWHTQFEALLENTVFDYIKRVFPDSKHIYCNTDVINLMNDKKLGLLKERMDLITVYDPEWAKEKELLFVPNIYPNIKCSDGEINSDLYFIGNNKNNRGAYLCEVAKKARENGAKSNFIVRQDEPNELFVEMCRSNGVCGITGQKISYAKVLEEVKETNCLLEIKIGKINACSLRIQEAVILGKKILTNNKAVLEMPCCKDSPWISVFDEIEDIDWEFVKTKEKVDYGYHNEYSYKTWIETVEAHLI